MLQKKARNIHTYILSSPNQVKMSLEYLRKYVPASEFQRISAKHKTKTLKALSKRLPASDYNKIADIYNRNDQLIAEIEAIKQQNEQLMTINHTIGYQAGQLATEMQAIKHQNLVLSEHVRLLSTSVETLAPKRT